MNDETAESDRERADAVIGIVGVLGTVVTVATVIWKEPALAVGIAAGAGWMLVAVLYLRARSDRQRINQLQRSVRALNSDLAEARRTAGEWSATASNVSSAVTTVMTMLPLGQNNPPPRVTSIRPEADVAGNVEGAE